MDDEDKPREQPRYSIGELADLGGVSRRTVRYYVQRGLLEAPTGLGRGRHYTRRHLDTLTRVRKLQEAGYGLAEIAGGLPSRPASDLQSARIPDSALAPDDIARPSFSRTIGPPRIRTGMSRSRARRLITSSCW